MRHGVVERSFKASALPRMEEPNGMTSRRSFSSELVAVALVSTTTISRPEAHTGYPPLLLTENIPLGRGKASIKPLYCQGKSGA